MDLKTLEELLQEVADLAGSDLHLLAGVPTKIRVHGRLEPVEDAPPNVDGLVGPLLSERHRAIFAERGSSCRAESSRCRLPAALARMALLSHAACSVLVVPKSTS